MIIKSEKGFTVIDIAISVIVLFLLVTLVAVLTYNINSTSKEVEYKTEATDIAINLIEQVKANGFSTYSGKYTGQVVEVDGTNTEEKQPVEGKEGFYQTITVDDYADDFQEGENKKLLDVVKIVTVKVSYNFKGEQSVELSVVLSK